MDSLSGTGPSGGHRRVARLSGAATLLAALVLLLHFVVNLTTPWGFHRDELLYLAMGQHLKVWSMDFPPLIAMLGRGTRVLFGDSLAAVRLAPALAASALVLVAGMIARELGGGRLAQGLAALALVTSPLFLRTGSLFQPVVLDQLAWTVGLYALVRLGTAHRDGDDELPWWLVVGAAGGFGLLAKFSIVFLGAGVLGAILLTSFRRSLLAPGPWIALLLTFAIGAPSVAGQVRLGWPVVAQMADLRSSQLERVTAGAFLSGQILWGPIVLLALAGAGWLLFAPAARPWRIAGWAAVLTFIMVMALHGKSYYAGPVYPALIAAGAVALERAPARAARPLAAVAALLLVAYGAVTLPLGVPMLAPPAMIRYGRALHLTAANTTNTGEVLPLPQDYADMLGWPELARATAQVYHALPPADRARAVVLADNYGEAGALDLFGPRLGLPPTVSPTGSYWFFGPGRLPGEVTIVVGADSSDLVPFFREFHRARTVLNPLGVHEEMRVPIWVARSPHATLQQVWPSLAGRN
jgi:4-amino-4-deoxy-L-arabinose transferase-like glycosyltransferase